MPFDKLSDKVFSPECSTETAYDGVKDVALSALMGINGNSHLHILSSIHISSLNVERLPIMCTAATIFAYGQTSSGKTYTMRGITEKAVNDIYMHILNVSCAKSLSLWRIYPLRLHFLSGQVD